MPPSDLQTTSAGPLPRLARISLVAFAVITNTLGASAETVLVHETFDTMRSSSGPGADTDREDLSAAGWRFWNRNPSASYRSISRPAGSTSQVLRNNSSSEHTFAFIQWDAVSLDDSGSSLSVSFDYRALPAAGDPDFEVAFLSANPISSRLGGANPTATSPGYGYRQTSGGTHGLTKFATRTGAPLRLNHEPSGPIRFTDAHYRIVFTMTRLSGGILLDFSVNGSTVSRHLETASDQTRFDTLRFASRNSQVDNVSVIHTPAIPEPSIYAGAR